LFLRGRGGSTSAAHDRPCQAVPGAALGHGTACHAWAGRAWAGHAWAGHAWAGPLDGPPGPGAAHAARIMRRLCTSVGRLNSKSNWEGWRRWAWCQRSCVSLGFHRCVCVCSALM